MKGKFLILLFFLFNSSLFSQQLIAEFNSSYTTSELGNVKMDIKWSLYDDHLLMSYNDKFTVKSMKQIGQEPFVNLPYKLSKEVNESSLWYFYQDEIIQIKVILEGIPKPSVIIKTKKDDFTGALGTTTTYFSLLK